MYTDVAQALVNLEDALDDIRAFVKAAGYGLRLATRRLGDLGSSPTTPVSVTGTEMEELRTAVARAPDRMSDLALLAVGDHLGAFLGRALGIDPAPELPDTVMEFEELTGTPNALASAGAWFPRFLQLRRIVLEGGGIDRKLLATLDIDDLEIPYPGGKMKRFGLGDPVTLTEGHLGEVCDAVLAGAKHIRRGLATM